VIRSTRIARIRTRRIRLVATLIMIAVAATALGVIVRHAHTRESTISELATAANRYSQWPMVTTRRLSVLFTGDDFAAGYGGVGLNAYPYILCNAVGLTCHVDAQIGTGLVNDGRRYSARTLRLIDRLPVDARLYDPDVIIIDAGRNDVEATPQEYAAALKQYMQELNRLWAHARIVVVLPAYLSDHADASYPERAALTTDAVKLLGGIVIDPIARGWYAGVDMSSLKSGHDGHPNQQGHELIAHKLAEALEDLGIAQIGAVR
jgi:lysophospholipase L1-like esterase